MSIIINCSVVAIEIIGFSKFSLSLFSGAVLSVISMLLTMKEITYLSGGKSLKSGRVVMRRIFLNGALTSMALSLLLFTVSARHIKFFMLLLSFGLIIMMFLAIFLFLKKTASSKKEGL